jgi:hypothetical protein
MLKILTGNNTGFSVIHDIFLQIIFLTYVEQQFKYFQYSLYSQQLNIKPTETETQERISTHLYTCYSFHYSTQGMTHEVAHKKDHTASTRCFAVAEMLTLDQQQTYLT